MIALVLVVAGVEQAAIVIKDELVIIWFIMYVLCTHAVHKYIYK